MFQSIYVWRGGGDQNIFWCPTPTYLYFYTDKQSTKEKRIAKIFVELVLNIDKLVTRDGLSEHRKVVF